MEQLFCVILGLTDLLWDCLLFKVDQQPVVNIPLLCVCLSIGAVVCTFSNFFHDFLLFSFVL